MITPVPGPAEVITAGLLYAAGVTVTGVDIDELDTTLTAGPWRGREAAQATARIEFATAGTAERRQMPVRIGYTLAMAAATGAPIRVARQLAVAAQDDLAGQFTRNVPLPQPTRWRPPYAGTAHPWSSRPTWPAIPPIPAAARTKLAQLGTSSAEAEVTL